MDNDEFLQELVDKLTFEERMPISSFSDSREKLDMMAWNEFCNLVCSTPLSTEQIVGLIKQENKKQVPADLEAIQATLEMVHGYCEDLGLVKIVDGINSKKGGTPIYRCVNYLDWNPNFAGLSFIPATLVGTAPAKNVADSRMSEKGDMMFYGADDERTSMIEVGRNISHLEYPATMGTFFTNKQFRILDLASISPDSLPSIFDVKHEDKRSAWFFLNEFMERISQLKPEKSDGEDDFYKPTQVFTKYIQRNTDLKGIKFKSSKADGNCYVLFVVNRDCVDKGDKIDSSRNQLIMDKVEQMDFDSAGIKKGFDLRGETQKSSEDHPLRMAYERNHIYFANFEDAMHLFEDNLSRKEHRSILDKLMIGKKYVHDKYIQEASEITVLAYIFKHFNKSFRYEPKYNGGSNPECSFEFKGKTINVEVKCPNLEKWIQAEERNTVKIDFVERVPNHTEIADDISQIVTPNLKTSNYDGIEVVPRFDNKLKDYLVGAHKKFPVSDDSNFNILIISLDIPSDMDKWYGYIMGDNGALTGNTYISEEYKNVDAIVLTNIVNGHTGWCVHNANVWDMRQYINIMFLNLDRQDTETGRFFFREVNGMFGLLTKAFNDFLEELDREAKNDKDYMEYKTKEIGIISDFVNKLIRGEIKI